MSFFHRIDIGWFYVLCGLVLTVAAIVFPAHKDLQELQAKRTVIQQNVAELEYQIQIYESFLKDLYSLNPELHDRIYNMQMRVSPDGAIVVKDASAANTPLEWIAQRARRDRIVHFDSSEDSILTGLSSGRSRLYLAGVGVFAMFVGFIKSHPTTETLPD